MRVAVKQGILDPKDMHGTIVEVIAEVKQGRQDSA